ncbi:hypothetical protein PR048_006174 [Dryococelus australis]|uniref:Uncharacterized protein n=1 Tax=Dryococelus australis TaxID=614101 RepID=A0ABQ9IBB8_9NEOP|nr:hypothetical protein PR048_006174 [Dryococelus australis]
MSLRSAGKLEEFKVVSEAVFTPTRAGKINAAYRHHKLNTVTPYTPHEALIFDWLCSSRKGNNTRWKYCLPFFAYAHQSAEITGVNEELITKSATILHVLSSVFEVDIDAFRAYALDTAYLYVNEYPMLTSQHKILIHGAGVISVALLPIGVLKEEYQEARNKDFRRFRENRCRKTSGAENNREFLNMFLTSSNPIISSVRPPPLKMFHNITAAMLARSSERI